MNTNGVLSFGQPFYYPFSSNGLNFGSILTPPIIAPFWDDINVVDGGEIYFRLETEYNITSQLVSEIATQFSEAVKEFLNPSVFVATWDRVAAFDVNYDSLANTFQVIVISDGTRTFVKFIYGDIQWGGSTTLIGVSTGDGFNFTTISSSLTSSVYSLSNTSFTDRIDGECQIFD